MGAKALTTYESDKLRILSLLCIIQVLAGHASFHDFPDEIQGMAFNHYLQAFCGAKLGWCVIPAFFAISGYLFFRNIRLEGSWGETYAPLWPKLGRRVRTLLVPYLFAAWFLPVALYVAGQIPFAAEMMNCGGGDNPFQGPLLPLLQRIYWGATWWSLPATYPLWFLRNLIVIIAFSPLLVAVLKVLHGRGGWFVVMGVLFLVVTIWPGGFPWIFVNLFWFLFGACCLERLSAVGSWLFPLAYAVIVTAELAIPWAGWAHLQVLSSAIGLTALWTLYDKLVPATFQLDQHPWLKTACNFTFFIYLFHEPLLHIVRKLLVLPLGHTSLSFALSYLLSPWLFAALWICVGLAFRRCLPRVYKVLTGSR